MGNISDFVKSVVTHNMGLTILPPTIEESENLNNEFDDASTSESDESMLEEDDYRPSKRLRLSSAKHLTVPGEIITDETQWMRYESFHTFR